jgi:hypothetical protein
MTSQSHNQLAMGEKRGFTVFVNDESIGAFAMTLQSYYQMLLGGRKKN